MLLVKCKDNVKFGNVLCRRIKVGRNHLISFGDFATMIRKSETLVSSCERGYEKDVIPIPVAITIVG
jgi:hypothetical protein